MNVLVTGGAGFIGSHVVLALVEAGHTPVVFDDLSAGHRDAVLDAELIEGSLLDRTAVEWALRSSQAEAVIHLAGLIKVGESVRQPLRYYRCNTGGSLTLLEAMAAAGVRDLVFSSTAAVYGEPETVPIAEEHPKRPMNPYGASKWMVERMLADQAAAGTLRYAAPRYFNAAGADPGGRLGERHEPETHLIPRAVLAALGKGPPLQLFGDDWPTPDGTPVRDYVHVADLADAHVRAVEYVAEGGESGAFNLGTGKGTSILEIVAAIEAETGRTVPLEVVPRRAGDPAFLVADPSKAQRVLGWQAGRSNVRSICHDAAAWFSK